MNLCRWFLPLMVAHSASAGLVIFYDQAAWQAAAGQISFTENFESFAADTQFRTVTVQAHGFTLRQILFNRNFRNAIDVPPFEFLDNNGTRSASLFTEFGEFPTQPLGTQVRLAFDARVAAFGGQSFGAADSEMARIDIVQDQSIIGSMSIGGGSPTFFGFVATDGDYVTSLNFRSTIPIAGAGEGFGLDNLMGVNFVVVPEPGVSLFAIGLCLVLALDRSTATRQYPNSVLGRVSP